MIAGQAVALAYKLVGKIPQDYPNRPILKSPLRPWRPATGRPSRRIPLRAPILPLPIPDRLKLTMDKFSKDLVKVLQPFFESLEVNAEGHRKKNRLSPCLKDPL